MENEALSRPNGRSRSEAAAGQLNQLQAENKRLADEARRVRAVADGIGLGLSTARKQLKEAEAENAQLRRDCEKGRDVPSAAASRQTRRTSS